MIRILVLSDTHIRHSETSLPKRIVEEAVEADLIVHAGDFTGKETYDYLCTLNEVIGVAGNTDDMLLSGLLPVMRTITIGDIRIGLTHSAGRYDQAVWRARSLFEDVELIVFGHTHLPFNESVGDVQMFNPGSPTDPRNAPYPSYGIIEIEGKEYTTSIVPLH